MKDLIIKIIIKHRVHKAYPNLEIESIELLKPEFVAPNDVYHVKFKDSNKSVLIGIRKQNVFGRRGLMLMLKENN